MTHWVRNAQVIKNCYVICCVLVVLIFYYVECSNFK